MSRSDLQPDSFDVLRRLNPIAEAELPTVAESAQARELASTIAATPADRTVRARPPRRLPKWRVSLRSRPLLLGGVTVLIVIPAALAGGPPLFDHFFGTHAPAPVTRSFARWDEEMRSDAVKGFSAYPVLAARAVGVEAIDSPEGPIYLWVAPRIGGASSAECRLVQFGDTAAGGVTDAGTSCDTGAPASGSGVEVDLYYNAEHPSLLVLAGRAPAGTRSITINLAHGVVDVPAVRGYYLAAVPASSAPNQVTAVDVSGTPIASEPVAPVPAVQAGQH